MHPKKCISARHELRIKKSAEKKNLETMWKVQIHISFCSLSRPLLSSSRLQIFECSPKKKEKKRINGNALSDKEECVTLNPNTFACLRNCVSLFYMAANAISKLSLIFFSLFFCSISWEKAQAGEINRNSVAFYRIRCRKGQLIYISRFCRFH